MLQVFMLLMVDGFCGSSMLFYSALLNSLIVSSLWFINFSFCFHWFTVCWLILICREIAVLVDSGLVLIGGKMSNEEQQQDHLE